MKDFATSDNPAVQAQLDRLAALSLPQGRLGLEVIHTLLARLGDPQKRIPPAFHVAGTNGKGSTCAFLRAMLEAQGLAVHVAAKPHLVRYNERIRLAGELIGDEMLAALLREVLDAGEDLSPSFFEVTTAATFLAFAREPADACVIEVGLGGRYDATNVLEQPAACGIASLGLDHEQFLLAPEDGAPADPLVRIAFEKSGIARTGSPLVVQYYPAAMADEIVNRAAQGGAALFARDRDWFAETSSDSILYRDRLGELTLPLPTLPGAHQAENAALAVAMLRHQDRVDISPDALAKGIVAARWPARLQWLSSGPLTALVPQAKVLLDGGHNPDASAALAQYLAQLGGPVHAVVGMLSGKDAGNYLRLLAPQLASLTAIPSTGSDAHAPETLAAIAQDAGIAEVATAISTDAALRALAEKPGTVLIAGSLYLAGVVLRANEEVPD